MSSAPSSAFSCCEDLGPPSGGRAASYIRPAFGMTPLQRQLLDRCRAAAEAHGGRCVSTRFSSTARLRWRCARGHAFTATSHQVHYHGRWCPRCRREALAVKALLVLRRQARSLGGECLSKRYVDCRHRMAFRCAKGHRWRTTSEAVAQGQWCPHCGAEKRNEAKRRRKFLSVQRIATNHGGRCLARTYVDQYTKMRWRCAEGHEWVADACTIGLGRWCPTCKRERHGATFLSAFVGWPPREAGGAFPRGT